MVRLFRKKKKDPKKVIADCLSAVFKEKLVVERHIKALQNEEEKTMQGIRQCQKKGVPEGCRPMAVSIVKARKTKHRLNKTKLQLESIERNLQQQRSATRVTGTVESSAEVMAAMSELVKVPEMRKSAVGVSKKLLKLGLIDKQQHKTFKDASNTDVLDTVDEADIEEVLSSVAKGYKGRPQTGASTMSLNTVGMTVEHLTDHTKRMSVQERGG